MIITISGANFSASNIGTLSTWTVSKSIGAGAEHSIPSYVDKNSAFNYTITLKDGYTFGTYSVSMGGQIITPTVTETSMTINIASVTGAIRIEVKTINSSTGEEDEPVTPKPEKPSTGGDNISWLINGYQSDGSINSLTTRARAFVKVDDMQNATIVGNNNVKYCLYAFESNFQASYKGKLDGFETGSSNMINELSKKIADTSSIKYIGITGAYSNDAEITDIDAFGNNFTFTGVSNANLMPANIFVSGGISSNNGELVSNGNRVRTLALNVENVTITNNPGYQHIVYLYSGEAADETCFVSKLNDWATETSLASVPSTATHYRIVVKNDAGTAITAVEGNKNTTISK